MNDMQAPAGTPLTEDLDPFMFYALSLHSHAISFGALCNADGAAVANGLFHALCMHLALDPKKEDGTLKAFADALPGLVSEYSKSASLLLLRSSKEQPNEQADDDTPTEPSEKARQAPAS